MIIDYYKNLFVKRYSKSERIKTNGYTTTDLSIAIIIIGILATILVPKFSSSLEFIEVLIAEKHLYDAVKKCQAGLINDEIKPQYRLPTKDMGLGIFRNNKFSFAYTGIEDECISDYEPNQIRLSRTNNQYSLIINLITGERTSEGELPEWLDWWEDFYSPLIPENDPMLYEY